MSAIEVKNLKKYFGKVKAVDGISFDVGEGEIFGFLGPNGAGKTTTVRCMMDFLRPDKGSITILGLDSQKDSVGVKKVTGHLAGDIKLYDSWTGEDHINLVMKMRGDGEYAKELSKRLNFDSKMKVFYLSTGNKQKLGLILALMSKPKLLILDEPTVGLDPLLQNEVYQILKQLQKQGSTIFMSSHNLPEVERICERVAIIKKGKLVALEHIEDLKRKAIYEITIYFAENFNESDFNLPNIKIVNKLDNSLMMTAKGDLSQFFKILSTYKLKDVNINRASLDQIFLEHYSK
jgi:ABC-2 type transport system ATP-binding protein